MSVHAEEIKNVRYDDPNASAVTFHNSTAQVKALCGPVGSGKTLAAQWEWVYLCREARVPLSGLVVRESYKQLTDSYLQTWNRHFGHVSHYHQGNHILTLGIPNVEGKWLEHKLHLRHLRRVEEASDWMSTEWALVHLEEVVPAFQIDGGVIGGGLPEGAFELVLTRQRFDGAHRLHVLVTFNPPSKFHWTYKHFFQPSAAELAAKDFILIQQPAYENIRHLHPLYYKRLEAQLGPELVRRFVKGEVVTIYPGVRVYPEFQDRMHFRDEVQAIPGLPLSLGFDWGLTPVALITQLTPKGQLRCLKELQLWNCGARKLGERLVQLLNEEFTGYDEQQGWGDPAGETRDQSDEAQAFGVIKETTGIHVQPGAVDFTSRKEATRETARRLDDEGEPAIVIDRQGCPILTEGLLGGYRYPRYPSGQVGEKPIKNEFSHVANALEYLCTGLFSVRTGKPKTRPQPRQRAGVLGFDPLNQNETRRRRSWMVH